jgi:hypothetical protein
MAPIIVPSIANIRVSDVPPTFRIRMIPATPHMTAHGSNKICMFHKPITTISCVREDGNQNTTQKALKQNEAIIISTESIASLKASLGLWPFSSVSFSLIVLPFQKSVLSPHHFTVCPS